MSIEESFKMSLRDELPRLFRSRLEVALGKEGAPVLDNRQRSEMASMVADCCDELIGRNRTRIARGEDVHTPSAGSQENLDNADVDMDSGTGEPALQYETEVYQE